MMFQMGADSAVSKRYRGIDMKENWKGASLATIFSKTCFCLIASLVVNTSSKEKKAKRSSCSHSPKKGRVAHTNPRRCFFFFFFWWTQEAVSTTKDYQQNFKDNINRETYSLLCQNHTTGTPYKLVSGSTPNASILPPDI